MYTPIEGFSAVLISSLAEVGAILPISASKVAELDAVLGGSDWTYLRIISDGAYEIVKVYSIVGTQAIISRAQSGTERSLFPTGATVDFIATYAGVVDFVSEEVPALTVDINSDFYPIVDGGIIELPTPTITSNTPLQVVGEYPKLILSESIKATETDCQSDVINSEEVWISYEQFMVRVTDFGTLDEEVNIPYTYEGGTREVTIDWEGSLISNSTIFGVRGTVSVELVAATLSGLVEVACADEHGILDEVQNIVVGQTVTFDMPLELANQQYAPTDIVLFMEVSTILGGDSLDEVVFSADGLEFRIA